MTEVEFKEWCATYHYDNSTEYEPVKLDGAWYYHIKKVNVDSYTIVEEFENNYEILGENTDAQ